MSRLLVLIACVSVVGCDSPQFDRAFETRRGEARLVLFRECMELAAKMPRQSDDDVSDVVEACSTQAYYMANQATK